MTLVDTYKYGSLWVDAMSELEWLEDRDLLTDTHREILTLLQDSGIEFQFDTYEDRVRTKFRAIEIMGAGGYPGDSIDDSNARVLKELSKEWPSTTTESNWFGGCEHVTLLFDLENGTVEDAEAVIELAEAYSDYPVLDEDDWSELATERWFEMVDEMVVDTENSMDIVFTEAQREDITELAGAYHGYWEEGYFPEEEWDNIVKEVLATEAGTTVQLHQATKLW